PSPKRSGHRRLPSRHQARLRVSYRYETLFTSSSFKSCSARSENLAENFSADILLARLMVGHHALGRRKDGDAEAIGHLRDGLHRRVNAASGLGNAGDFTDNRLALEIFQLDLDLGLAVVEIDLRVIA